MSTAFAATDFITSGARSKTQDPMILDAESEEGLSGRVALADLETNYVLVQKVH